MIGIICAIIVGAPIFLVAAALNQKKTAPPTWDLYTSPTRDTVVLREED